MVFLAAAFKNNLDLYLGTYLLFGEKDRCCPSTALKGFKKGGERLKPYLQD